MIETLVTAVFFTVTEIVAVFLGFFTEVTTILVFPAAIPLTLPFASTVATFGLRLLYVTFLFAALFGLTVTVVLSLTV